MKLSLTLHEKTYSIVSDEAFDGTNLNELVEQFKGLLVNAGFHPSNVDDMFNTDYQWFTEEERQDNMQGHFNVDKRVEEWQNNMYRPEKVDEYDEKYNNFK